MIHLDELLAYCPRATPTHARLVVLASVTGLSARSQSPHQIQGIVVGPRCEYATTLTTQFPLIPGGAASSHSAETGPSCLLRAEAQLLEPCFWEPQHPFCYELRVELHGESGKLDERRMLVGVRHLAVVDGRLRLNGRELVLRGVGHGGPASPEELMAWRDSGCLALLADASSGLCEGTDRWGPMVLHALPAERDRALAQVVALRNHPSLMLWVLPPHCPAEAQSEWMRQVLSRDPSRPVAVVPPQSGSSAPATEWPVLQVLQTPADGSDPLPVGPLLHLPRGFQTAPSLVPAQFASEWERHWALCKPEHLTAGMIL